MTTALIDVADVAKLIRSDLKRAFPNTKFKVRISRFAGGTAVDIRWTDGPTTQQVDHLANSYRMGDFNGMDDSYHYRPSQIRDGRAVEYGAKYIQCRRDYSAAFAQHVTNQLCERYGLDPFTVRATAYGADWSDAYHIRLADTLSLQDLIYRTLSATECTS